MLLGEDPRGQRFRRVVLTHGNRRLKNDRAVIQPFIDEVYRRPRHLDAVLERSALSIEAWEGGQQRRMDVHDPVRVAPYESRGEQPHVSRKADQLAARRVEGLRHPPIVRFSPAAAPVIDHHRFDPARARELQSPRFRFVRDDQCDARGNRPRLAGARKCLQVRAAPADQNAESACPLHR
jgi:hypothetical protein